jgi:hypothetical protein
VAFAIDVDDNERVPFEPSLKNAGNDVAGPFRSEQQAQDFAIQKLIAGRKRLETASRSDG